MASGHLRFTVRASFATSPLFRPSLRVYEPGALGVRLVLGTDGREDGGPPEHPEGLWAMPEAEIEMLEALAGLDEDARLEYLDSFDIDVDEHGVATIVGEEPSDTIADDGDGDGAKEEL